MQYNSSKTNNCVKRIELSRRTDVDVDIKNFTLASDLASLAVLAAVTWVDALTLALALVAHRLHLLDEARQQLLYVYLCAGTTAASA